MNEPVYLLILEVTVPLLLLCVFKFRHKLYDLFMKYVRPFLTWRILICYLPLWFIATGWTYPAIAFGSGWIRKAGLAWTAFMWMPWCPEKLITIPCAIWLHKKLFPNHSTSALDDMLKKEKDKLKKKKDRNKNS